MRSLFLFLFCLSAWGQSSLKGTQNNDLRSQKEVFSIAWSQTEYKLESSTVGQFNLNYYKEEKLMNTWKVDSNEAQGIDDEFVDKFITFKYEMAHLPKKECKSLFELRMHGEGQTVCSKEEEKIKILEKFIEDLEKKFS